MLYDDFNDKICHSIRVLSSLTLQSLLFSISLLFFVFRFPQLFRAFFLSFPRILGGVAFLGGFPSFFSKKTRVGGEGQGYDDFYDKLRHMNKVAYFVLISCKIVGNFRVVKTVFLENGIFAPCRKQVVLTKKQRK